MPAIVRKLVVIAAVDGLILQPLHHRGQRPLKLDYRSKKLSTIEQVSSNNSATSLECHGIVGSGPLSNGPAAHLLNL